MVQGAGDGWWNPFPEFLICRSISKRYLQWKAFEGEVYFMRPVASPNMVAILATILDFMHQSIPAAPGNWLGNGPGVGKCPAPGQHKICKCPTPGTDKAGKCPASNPGGGGWAQPELTDALSRIRNQVKPAKIDNSVVLKDGAHYCYCSHFLRMPRQSHATLKKYATRRTRGTRRTRRTRGLVLSPVKSGGF